LKKTINMNRYRVEAEVKFVGGRGAVRGNYREK
jgi:hypothetical protein